MIYSWKEKLGDIIGAISVVGIFYLLPFLQALAETY